MTFFLKTKQLLIKRIFSLISLSFLINPLPLLSSHSTQAQQFTPTKFLIKFYELGLIDTHTLQVFQVLNSSKGVEIDLSKKGNISTLASGVKPVSGTFNAIYAVVDNTYTVAGSTGTCHTKAGSYNKIYDSNTGLTGWAAHTTNQSEAGDAVLTEQDFFTSTGQSGYFGPAIPNTQINVQGSPVNLMYMFLTNSSYPYSMSTGNPDRALYLGILFPIIKVNSASQGQIIITFDSTNGGSFDRNCALGLDLIDNKFTFSIIQ